MELNCWAGLHQLYALAERQQLARLPVDRSGHADTRSSIVQEYLAPLLLACSKPNQLRQHDIAGAYRAFRVARSGELQDPELGEGLFAVDMHSDQPPVSQSCWCAAARTQFRYINTKALITTGGAQALPRHPGPARDRVRPRTRASTPTSSSI
jgi:hypothetical protein